MILIFAFNLDSLVKSIENDGTTIAIIFYDLEKDSLIYEYNSKRRLPPASIQKVITTFAAIKLFKSDFKFKTYFFKHNNDLYLFPNADPLLDENALLKIAKDISSLGYKKFSNLYYDDSYFTKSRYPSGWFWDDIEQAYAPAISPLILNEGVFSIQYQAIPKHNFGDLLYVKLISSNKNNYEVENDTVIVYGDFSKYKNLVFPQKEPEQFFLWSFKNALYKNNVKVENVKGYKELPPDAELIYIYESSPIDSVLKYMNSVSSNLISEIVLRSIGVWLYSVGDWKNGIKGVKNILFLEGIDTNFVMIDGSGLSRYNLIPAKTFIDIFKSAYKDKQTYERLLSVLVEPGEGTLKNRLKEFKGRLKAKTGTLRNTTSLVGIIDKKIAFCIIIYGFNDSISKYKKIIDNVVLGTRLERVSP
ncbi:MAG: D-alanyl-D-alanine carboxypeptidase/D-alanyl-D-alanine-endopeptidase [candidate division WOR-3 bacterium]|nr:D-alanyl-D-alanine carboxypeptidase/D-alanyl-D-alanine-endopeptidase [candidate division WOR-3 bacterium]MCX7947600.1 D-alanyl-D-alanine carboxypeptidase/D-alanyl-D-alanine-endopeptidase [candidate division WOR-3 bacterium]MDW8150485.1 D-alanyl-D-alanine carboxypeptidase/D-alanyl-D-alanine-endopeptidase [candidate division WOR-3 bacterium]